MPVTKSAEKKLRQDKQRTTRNEGVKRNAMTLIKKVRKNPTTKSVAQAVSAIDKAVKHGIYHKNKAARIKSTLAKLAKPESKATKPTPKTKAKKV